MEHAIHIDRLGKRFGTTHALDEVSLDVRAGEVYGLLGPNGAGKTTLLRLLLGLLRPTSGRATILGLDVQRDAIAVHERVGYVPGEMPVWPWLTGRETLELLACVHGNVDVAYRDELVDRFAFDPTRRGRTYSHGNRQKIAVIHAFSTRAPVLVLDEPTGGLDPIMEMVFRECIHEARERGQAVLLSSHMLSEVEATCDRVAILRAGRLVEQGRLEDLRALLTRTVRVRFQGAVPDLHDIEGVTAVQVAGSSATVHVIGEIGPLVQALGSADVLDVLSHEASLEEIFLTYYGDDERL